MRGRITKRAVDALAAPATGEAVLWDDALAGFGVRVRPGNVKAYVVLYRAGAGRSAPLRKVTIGKHGSPWTPDTARTEAKRLLGLVAGGADPAGVKSERRMAESMADLAARFLAEHVDAKRKDRTAAEYRRLLDKIILPALGKKKIGDVTRADIARLHHANRDAPYQANRMLAVLSKMFNLAEAWGIRPDGSNPCRHIERNPERGRERMLSAAELARLGDALAAYDCSRPTCRRRSSCCCSPARGCRKSSACIGTTSISSAARRGCRIPRPAPRRCTCRRPRWPCWPACRACRATCTSLLGRRTAPGW